MNPVQGGVTMSPFMRSRSKVSLHLDFDLLLSDTERSRSMKKQGRETLGHIEEDIFQRYFRPAVLPGISSHMSHSKRNLPYTFGVKSKNKRTRPTNWCSLFDVAPSGKAVVKVETVVKTERPHVTPSPSPPNVEVTTSQLQKVTVQSDEHLFDFLKQDDVVVTPSSQLLGSESPDRIPSQTSQGEPVVTVSPKKGVRFSPELITEFSPPSPIVRPNAIVTDDSVPMMPFHPTRNKENESPNVRTRRVKTKGKKDASVADKRLEKAQTEDMHITKMTSVLNHRQSFRVTGTSGQTYDVEISSTPHCTCPDHLRKHHGFCKHILFVLLGLGVPASDPLLKQNHISSTPLRAILNGNYHHPPPSTTLDDAMEITELVITNQKRGRKRRTDEDDDYEDDGDDDWEEDEEKANLFDKRRGQIPGLLSEFLPGTYFPHDRPDRATAQHYRCRDCKTETTTNSERDT
ncbi:C3HC4 type zinc-finger domain-containing protein [Planoprotostelium fungivorum]|uniref:C3HC4 type zinc-finger domain-containing protein n=1 Tax=Planoprotostelium fungivorum TaxID=1890364 RepID=A0A2P6NQG8_9EUKA|nr:C3HC4 type zinc-finger domain-containing protein [Planoprotostelium fungivorum]